MSSFAVTLQCPNPECLYTENSLGQSVCDRCQNPLTYRYLWAVGSQAAQMPARTLIDCRYAVLQPQIWLDTQPGLSPQVAEIPESALPYLHLYSHRLHLPQLFGLYQAAELGSAEPGSADRHLDQPTVFLLDNAPIDRSGQLQPLLDVAWSSASAVRQLNWLWQMLQLWLPLKAQGVVSSLLVVDNLHVEGWRLRLRELIADQVTATQQPVERYRLRSSAEPGSVPQVAVMEPPARVTTVPLTSTFFTAQTATASLSDLAEIWQVWAETAQPQIRTFLEQICIALRSTPETEAGIETLANRLNPVWLEQAAALPLQVETAGGTTIGPQRSHNEDTCYPNAAEATPLLSELPGVGIICDGIGGHAGGEVASQLALRSLRLQLQTWMAELKLQPQPLSPQIITEQLTGMVRVVNNLIAAQNDLHGREQRQRMGTTLAMAIQPPQVLSHGNTHELYLVHVGNSRAYWLTAEGCQLLTVDDDVATREVRAGRSLYSQTRQRPDAASLTQALGTREADLLKITVQRFVIDQDGILLLCSDGLSDQGLIETFWEAASRPVLNSEQPLKTAVQTWLDLADRYNGHDNASIVLMQCRLNSQPQLFHTAGQLTSPPHLPQTELTDSAKALLYGDDSEAASAKAAVLPKQAKSSVKSTDSWLIGLGITALMFILGILSIAIWREVAPTSGSVEQPPTEIDGQE